MYVDKFNLIEEFKIEESPKSNSRKKLKELLKIFLDEKTGVLTISFTYSDPVLAQELVNFIVDVLKQKILDMGLDKNHLRKLNLEQNIDTSYKEIIRFQDEIQQLEYSVSNVYSSANIPIIMRDIALLKTELSVQEQVYEQLKVQYELLKVAMASEQPIFQVLEYAEVPDLKSGPSRGTLCIIVTFAAGFFSVFLAFVLNAIKNIKNDPEAMAKLVPNKKEEK